MTEKRAQHLLDLNSRLAKAQARYELAHAESLKWEVAVAENKDIVTQQELEDTQIRDCVWNLYNQMCYRKGVSAEAKRDDLEEQLQMVKRTIVELGKIVKMAKRRARRELKAIQKSEYQKKVKKVIRAKSYMSRMSALSTVSRSRTKSMRSIASTWDTRSMISTI
uniref:Flagellar FliJ protein n=1 Tax=Trichogramma kaykai TaxID=54128 RepID=A0ABD2W3Q6_9HYME